MTFEFWKVSGPQIQNIICINRERKELGRGENGWFSWKLSEHELYARVKDYGLDNCKAAENRASRIELRIQPHQDILFFYFLSFLASDFPWL